MPAASSKSMDAICRSALAATTKPIPACSCASVFWLTGMLKRTGDARRPGECYSVATDDVPYNGLIEVALDKLLTHRKIKEICGWLETCSS